MGFLGHLIWPQGEIPRGSRGGPDGGFRVFKISFICELQL